MNLLFNPIIYLCTRHQYSQHQPSPQPRTPPGMTANGWNPFFLVPQSTYLALSFYRISKAHPFSSHSCSWHSLSSGKVCVCAKRLPVASLPQPLPTWPSPDLQDTTPLETLHLSGRRSQRHGINDDPKGQGSLAGLLPPPPLHTALGSHRLC